MLHFLGLRYTRFVLHIFRNFFHQFSLHVIEISEMGRLLLLQLNDVKAKFCLHHTRHVARIGQRKDCRIKLGHHFPPSEEAQIAALGCAAFVGRVLSGKLGKVSTGLQVGQ